MLLKRDDILGTDDLKQSYREVQVPEWSGTVGVRVMSGTERGKFEISNQAAPKESIRGRICAATICDESCSLVFSGPDVETLGSKSSVALDRVFEVACEINGIGSKSVEAEAKNS